MHKFLLISFAFYFTGLASFAQPAGFTRVKDTAGIMKKVNEATALTNSISTSFVQEKNLAFLYEKIYSKGIMLYRKPDKLRLEYNSPYNYLLVMNAGKLLIKSDDKETRIDLESSSMFKEINNLIINAVRGKILDEPGLQAEFYENDKSVFIRLHPQQEEMKKYVSAIELYISKTDYTVSEFKVIELSEDFTLIKFVNKKINEEIPEGRFDTR